MLIIVPTNRPERIPHVVRQWRAQVYGMAELCLCPAPGLAMCVPSGVTVLQPTDTIGAARNVGIDYARGRGHTWAVFWDDDNTYGPSYCMEVAQHAQAGDVEVLSKGIAFVRHDSGMCLYESPLHFYPGHSTSVKVDACVEFPDLSLAEDVEWSRRMIAKGARAKHLPPWGLVYDRRGPEGHAYDACEMEFLRAHGPARQIGQWPDAAVNGPFDVLSFPLRSASDEEVFQALERRAAKRLGVHRAHV